MIKKSTAFIFAIITGLTGVFVGLKINSDFRSDAILSIIIVFNVMLIMSTDKKTKQK